jgi:hypothetical protein
VPETMIERVARAIHTASGDDRPAWEQLDSAQLAERLAQAKLAITSMRKPTDTMLLAAIRLDPAGRIEHQWPAMIDVALNG